MAHKRSRRQQMISIKKEYLRQGIVLYNAEGRENCQFLAFREAFGFIDISMLESSTDRVGILDYILIQFHLHLKSRSAQA